MGAGLDMYSLCTREIELAISGILLFIAAVTFFLTAKYYEKIKLDRERDLFHGISHALATVMHLGLLCL